MSQTKNNIKVIGFAAALTVLVILAIAVPSQLWSPYAYAAVATLVLTVILPFIVPAPMSPEQANDAQQIWLIGPLGSMHLGLLILAGATVTLALMQLAVASWVGVALWCGLVVVSYYSLRVGTAVVQKAASQTVTASEDARTQWTAVLRQVLMASQNVAVQKRLGEVVEKIRFAANDRGSQTAPENEAITTLVKQIGSAPVNEGELVASLGKLEMLLVQREDTLRAQRSKA